MKCGNCGEEIFVGYCNGEKKVMEGYITDGNSNYIGQPILHTCKAKTPKCSICGDLLYDYGNNSEPYCKGRCCNKCNEEVVIPERIKLTVGKRK